MRNNDSSGNLANSYHLFSNYASDFFRFLLPRRWRIDGEGWKLCEEASCSTRNSREKLEWNGNDGKVSDRSGKGKCSDYWTTVQGWLVIGGKFSEGQRWREGDAVAFSLTRNILLSREYFFAISSFGIWIRSS